MRSMYFGLPAGWCCSDERCATAGGWLLDVLIGLFGFHGMFLYEPGRYWATLWLVLRGVDDND